MRLITLGTLSRLPRIGLIALILTLTGCATAYQRQGITGGYTDEHVDDTTFRVRFKGNNYTSREQVETFLLYRCAELTDQLGYDSFVVVGQDTLDVSDLLAQVAEARNYHATALIKVYNGPDNPSAYNAKEVIRIIQSLYPQGFRS